MFILSLILVLSMKLPTTDAAFIIVGIGLLLDFAILLAVYFYLRKLNARTDDWS